MIANVKVPPWQQQWRQPTGEGPGYLIFRTMAPDFALRLNRFAEDRAILQLLGVHAAIRRYRWQYDRLPDRLEQLHLEADLTTDPFTGKPLIYRRHGDDYELYSAGPLDRSETGGNDPNRRVPIGLAH